MHLANMGSVNEKPGQHAFFKRRVAEAFNVGHKGMVSIIVILILVAIMCYFCSVHGV